MTIFIVAQISAIAGKESFVRTELEKLVNVTRSEVGCLQYDLHIDNDNAAFFVFYERWLSRDLWQTHMSAPHLSAYLAATDGCISNFVLNEMSAL